MGTLQDNRAVTNGEALCPRWEASLIDDSFAERACRSRPSARLDLL
jgi:hypothetical protein